MPGLGCTRMRFGVVVDRSIRTPASRLCFQQHAAAGEAGPAGGSKTCCQGFHAKVRQRKTVFSPVSQGHSTARYGKPAVTPCGNERLKDADPCDYLEARGAQAPAWDRTEFGCPCHGPEPPGPSVVLRFVRPESIIRWARAGGSPQLGGQRGKRGRVSFSSRIAGSAAGFLVRRARTDHDVGPSQRELLEQQLPQRLAVCL